MAVSFGKSNKYKPQQTVYFFCKKHWQYGENYIRLVKKNKRRDAHMKRVNNKTAQAVHTHTHTQVI